MRIDPLTDEIISDDDDLCPYCLSVLDDVYEWCEKCGEYVGVVVEHGMNFPDWDIKCDNCNAINSIYNSSCINCGRSPVNSKIKYIPNDYPPYGIQVLCENCNRFTPAMNENCKYCNHYLGMDKK